MPIFSVLGYQVNKVSISTLDSSSDQEYFPVLGLILRVLNPDFFLLEE